MQAYKNDWLSLSATVARTPLKLQDKGLRLDFNTDDGALVKIIDVWHNKTLLALSKEDNTQGIKLHVFAVGDMVELLVVRIKKTDSSESFINITYKGGSDEWVAYDPKTLPGVSKQIDDAVAKASTPAASVCKIDDHSNAKTPEDKKDNNIPDPSMRVAKLHLCCVDNAERLYYTVDDTWSPNISNRKQLNPETAIAILNTTNRNSHTAFGTAVAFDGDTFGRVINIGEHFYRHAAVPNHDTWFGITRRAKNGKIEYYSASRDDNWSEDRTTMSEYRYEAACRTVMLNHVGTVVQSSNQQTAQANPIASTENKRWAVYCSSYQTYYVRPDYYSTSLKEATIFGDIAATAATVSKCEKNGCKAIEVTDEMIKAGTHICG